MSVTAAQGFRAAGLACGIKESGALDLALVDAGRPVPAAAVFTRNQVQAAPVRWSRRLLEHNGGVAQGVILSSGNANAATGLAGDDTAARMAACAGDGPFLVCSTGLIGTPLPVERVEKAATTLRRKLDSTPEGSLDAARAIMTTDTRAKQSITHVGAVTVGGMAKGAAMLHPDMATMLAVITTDAEAEAPLLQSALGAAVDRTFNRLSVDGCMSTNDTVAVLASGEAGTVSREELVDALIRVCGDLAEQMARDAEGATRLVRVRVTGARNDGDAVTAARSVAKSDLVRCSFFGADPYWGRVISELGASVVPIEPERVAIRYGDVLVCQRGIAAPHDEKAAREAASGDEVILTADLGMGTASAEVLTCDLSHGYIDENKGRS
jgi:glutamate N-acetyltransferase / amino-acid N-acetyltransferase